MKRFFASGVAIAALATGAFAQDAATPVQAVAAPLQQSSTTTLPANTEVLLSMNDELTTKGGRVDVGTTFRLSVVHDVKVGDYVVIPRGTPAVGEVTWKTGKGAFGKSGKMEIELRYIDLNGRKIPVSGQYRQEGEGNTVATVAGVIAAGVFAGFITGKSARIPQGRELVAHTKDALPVMLPAAAAPAVATDTPVIVSVTKVEDQPAAATEAD